jgi:hypothetical protein
VALRTGRLLFKESIPITRRDFPRPTIADTTRINSEIRAKDVRVIDVSGQQLGILTIRDALAIATEKQLDLVEVAPNANPPVCRLMDYGKYLYEKQKRERESRKAQKQIEVKEVRLRPKTDEHDVQVVLACASASGVARCSIQKWHAYCSNESLKTYLMSRSLSRCHCLMAVAW